MICSSALFPGAWNIPPWCPENTGAFPSSSQGWQVLLALLTSTFSAHSHRTPSRGLEWTESPCDGGKQDLALPLYVPGKWPINDNYGDSLQSLSETRDQILPWKWEISQSLSPLHLFPGWTFQNYNHQSVLCVHQTRCCSSLVPWTLKSAATPLMTNWRENNPVSDPRQPALISGKYQSKKTLGFPGNLNQKHLRKSSAR